MSDSSQCPSAETLALLPDGRARHGQRLSLMVHLDGCTQCRRVLAYAGQYQASAKPAPREDVPTAFRVGVQLAVLRAAIEEGRRKDAASAVVALRSLSGPEIFSARWSSLEAAAPKCLPRDHFLDELARELSSRLDPEALALGRWAETSRLAAAGRNRSFFASPCFERTLKSLEDQLVLREIRDALAVSRIDLKRLERGFRRLILQF